MAIPRGDRALVGRPFYGGTPDLPPHGYIVPRDELDAELLAGARRAGATVFEECAASTVERRDGRVTIAARLAGRAESFEARLVVGADGAHSIVARAAGLHREDPRHVAVSQRAYVDGVTLETGEAAFFFDRDLFPGYGWMFPMPGGRANVGVGILAEARTRWNLGVPQIFQSFIDKLRAQHPGGAGARVASRPLGGIVRTYGWRGRYHGVRGRCGCRRPDDEGSAGHDLPCLRRPSGRRV
jgi:flavin-dependent dehydrogenase